MSIKTKAFSNSSCSAWKRP